jgi:Protein of unknown function (DUF3105)
MSMTEQADERLEECVDPAPAVPRRSVWRWWLAGVVIGVVATLVVVVLLVIINNRRLIANSSQQIPNGGQPVSNGSAPAGTVIYPEPNRLHVTDKVQYDHSPPVGGNHWPVWLNCGIYDIPVVDENAVHSLEHGTVWITYLPDLSPDELDRLRALMKASYRGPNRYVILSPYPGQSAPIIASAWGYQLTLQAPTDPRLQSFIDYFRQGPQTLERGGRCSEGTGSPIG